MQAYFGRAKAACLCSYCCNRRLCYDGGRLGRVKIVTLRVGAPLLLTRPIFSPLFEFQHALSRAKHSCARRKRLHWRLLCSARVRTMVSLALGGAARRTGLICCLKTLLDSDPACYIKHSAESITDFFVIHYFRYANVFLHPVTDDEAPGYHSIVFRSDHLWIFVSMIWGPKWINTRLDFLPELTHIVW